MTTKQLIVSLVLLLAAVVVFAALRADQAAQWVSLAPFFAWAAQYDAADFAASDIAALIREAEAAGARDVVEAVDWWRVAASEGDVHAQLLLAVAYAHGVGTLTDLVRAHVWFSIASRNGNEYAPARRDIVALQLGFLSVLAAEEVARDCLASNYQDC